MLAAISLSNSFRNIRAWTALQHSLETSQIFTRKRLGRTGHKSASGLVRRSPALLQKNQLALIH